MPKMPKVKELRIIFKKTGFIKACKINQAENQPVNSTFFIGSLFFYSTLDVRYSMFDVHFFPHKSLNSFNFYMGATFALL